LEDNVTIYAGAKVIGGINIGQNSIIGANCVVVKNVPANCVVVGNPARIVRKNGVKVNIPL
jgi:serine O-acetyltransferase